MAAPTTSNAKTEEHPVMTSPLRRSLPDLRPGLVSIFQRNARHAYVVPSTRNFIQFAGGTDETTPTVQIRDAKLDHGIESSLFYFASSAAFVSFIESAPTAEQSVEDGILYNIKNTDSPGGPLVSLKMTRVDGFLLSLATDVVTPSIPIKLPHLAFHICSGDLDALINCTKLPLRVVQSLTQYRKSFQGRIVKRRKWALLGNYIIDQFASFKHRKVFFLCDMNVYNLLSYAHLVLDEATVRDMNYLGIYNPENEELHLIEDEVVPSNSVDYGDFL